LNLHPDIARRIAELSNALGWTPERIINEALSKYLGLESIPIEYEIMYGEREGESDKNISSLRRVANSDKGV